MSCVRLRASFSCEALSQSLTRTHCGFLLSIDPVAAKQAATGEHVANSA
jgi:hypothetical protein